MPGEVLDTVPLLSISSYEGQGSRVEGVIARFSKEFSHRPTHFIRVPGRVNLIGEHVDYCGYPVLPMAIEQDVFIASTYFQDLEGGGQRLTLVNTSPQYPPFHCLLKDIKLHLDGRKPGVCPPWHLYFLCGVYGILEHLGLNEDNALSMEICVSGSVPPRAGLSSSSALVCAAALNTVVANHAEGKVERAEIAGICASSERFIGTMGGGMDQAIAFLATPGTARRIHFLPKLSTEAVSLPSGAIFVVAHSLIEANKAASDGYNVRVAECRLATWIIAKNAGVADFLHLQKVRELQSTLSIDLNGMLELVQAHIHQGPYTPQEVAQELGLSLEELKGKPLMSSIPLDRIKLHIKNRIVHVLQESQRVEDFYSLCKHGTLSELGLLMNGSHQSLRTLYDCSHPQLDKLVGLAQSKAYGARLTGAGWGGCMVALCDQSQLPSFLDTLKNEFYIPLGADMEAQLFVTQPGAGATIFT